MRVPLNSAIAAYILQQQEGAQLDKSVGRAMGQVARKDAEDQIDQQHAAQCKQANELYEAANKMGWITKIGSAVAAIGTFSSGIGFAMAVAGGPALGLSAIVGGCFMMALPTALSALLGNTISKGIGAVVVEGDRDDAAAAGYAAGSHGLVFKDDQNLLERSGTRNVDRGRAQEQASYQALLQLTGEKS